LRLHEPNTHSEHAARDARRREQGVVVIAVTGVDTGRIDLQLAAVRVLPPRAQQFVELVLCDNVVFASMSQF
jgi:hypothetical protein